MKQAWLFQATPKSFKIDQFLEEKPSELSFLASQHASEMRAGDRVYIWRSKGTDPEWKSGIIAICEIIQEAAEQSEDPDAISYWQLTDTCGKRILPRVRLKLLKVLNPRLSRSEVRSSPILKDMAVFQRPRATNYYLSPAEAEEINRLRPL
jgi:predicted RNA-binding protein with PUA-like domain